MGGRHDRAVGAVAVGVSAAEQKPATVAEAIAAWEAKGPTSLTVALMAEALYSVREVCDHVEANPLGWGGAPVVSLVRTLRTRVYPPEPTP